MILFLALWLVPALIIMILGLWLGYSALLVLAALLVALCILGLMTGAHRGNS